MFRSSVLVTFLALSGSALGFVVQLLLAQRFGVGVEVDAYLFALSTPTFIAGMMSTMLSYSVVPRLVACEADNNYQNRYMTSLLIGITGLSLLLAVVGSRIGTLQINMLPVDSTIRIQEKLPLLVLLAWLIGACQIIQGCLAAMLNAVHRYLASSLLSLLPYVGMIALLMLDGAAGIVVVPLGMLAGTLAAAVAGGILLRRHLLTWPFSNLLWPEMRQLAHSAPYTVVAMTCFSSYAVVDAYWATQASQGALATLGYAQRLIIAAGNLAVAGPSAVLVTHFAALIREKKFPDFNRFLMRTLLVVGGIASGVALVMAVFAEEIVQLLFSRGSFGKDEVTGVANTLRHMAPGMVAMLVSVVALRALFCLAGGAKAAAILGLMWTMAYFVASMLLYYQGAPGLASGYSIVWMLYVGMILIVIFKYKNWQSEKDFSC